jgi:hypothetical protein
MAQYNHYMEELDIKETDYPFNAKELDKNGEFMIEDFFDLNYTLACIIYSHLRYFKDNCMIAHPTYMTYEEWCKIIDKMINAFKIYIQKDFSSKNKVKQMRYGIKLFAKYFYELWY